MIEKGEKEKKRKRERGYKNKIRKREKGRERERGGGRVEIVRKAVLKKDISEN